MNYFVYISDSKLEMLYEQITWAVRERLAYELSLDFHFIKANFSNTENQFARAKKLEMVERHLENKTGTIFSPSVYFRGEMDMLWGPYDEYENLVYFGGRNEFVQVGLGGTLTNCLGMSNDRPSTSSYSLSPYLVSALAKKNEIHDPQKGYTRSHGMRELNEWAMKAVVESNYTLMLPVERLKFLAKKIVYGHVDKFGTHTVLIGSPIYIAAVG